MSPVYDCADEAGRAQGIAAAVSAVRSGKLVVLPTDTLYGVGCDAFSADAVTALLEAKGRSREMPPPVLVPDRRTVDGLATDVPAYAMDLIEAFWPGPLTLVLRAQPTLHWDLGETNGTVAVRMPDDELAIAVLTEVGPMAVSSANRTGYPAAKDVLDAATQLGAAVEVYLDHGKVRGGLASTIVDCTSDRPGVLRLGALGMDVLQPVFDKSEAAQVAPTTEVDDVDAHASVAETNQTDGAASVAETEQTDGDVPAIQTTVDDGLQWPGNDSTGQEANPDD